MADLSITDVAVADRAAVYRKAAWRLLPLLCLCLVAAYFDRVNVGFAKLQMMDDLSFSNTVYGVGAGIFFLGYVLFEVPSNIYLHKFGARVWIARIMITWGLIGAAMAFVQTATQFYILRFLLGVAEAGFIPGTFYFLACWFPADWRGRIIALLLSALPLSSIMGGPLSGWILASFADVAGLRGWQWLFLIETIPSLVLGLVVWRILVNTPDEAPWLTDHEKHIINSDLAREGERKQAHTSVNSAFTSPLVWQLSLAYFCVASSVYVAIFWMPTLIKQHGETDVMRIGLLTAVPYLVAIAAMYACNTSSDRRGERRWHTAIPGFVTAIGLALSGMHFDSLALTMFALTLAAAGASAMQAAFWSVPPAFLGGAAAAAGFALINSVGNIAGFVSTSAVGWIADLTGNPQNSLVFFSGLAALGAMLILRLPSQLINHADH
ncbi:MAG: MFS transporter [Betaproteobacteria bacterium]|nr:MFS transporter [Betaproteobacteria bacterium]